MVLTCDSTFHGPTRLQVWIHAKIEHDHVLLLLLLFAFRDCHGEENMDHDV